VDHPAACHVEQRSCSAFRFSFKLCMRMFGPSSCLRIDSSGSLVQNSRKIGWSLCGVWMRCRRGLSGVWSGSKSQISLWRVTEADCAISPASARRNRAECSVVSDEEHDVAVVCGKLVPGEHRISSGARSGSRQS
jgi:hypothetical protein